MDHIDLTNTPHEIRPSRNGGIVVLLVGKERGFGIIEGDVLSFSNPVDYMTYIAQGYQETQRKTKEDEDEFNTTTFGELK